MALIPLKLPRLQIRLAIVRSTGEPTDAFHRYLNIDVFPKVEQAFNGLQDAVVAIQAAQVAAIAAQASANSAQIAAETAQAAADQALDGGGQMTPATSLKLSQPLGLILSGSDLGGSAGAVIGANTHVRRYGNGDQVTVIGGVATGGPFAYDTLFYVYYDDPSRLGGSVTYLITATEALAYSSDANPDRHYVGQVITPTDGGPDTTGVPGVRS